MSDSTTDTDNISKSFISRHKKAIGISTVILIIIVIIVTVVVVMTTGNSPSNDNGKSPSCGDKPTNINCDHGTWSCKDNQWTCKCINTTIDPTSSDYDYCLKDVVWDNEDASKPMLTCMADGTVSCMCGPGGQVFNSSSGSCPSGSNQLCLVNEQTGKGILDCYCGPPGGTDINFESGTADYNRLSVCQGNCSQGSCQCYPCGGYNDDPSFACSSASSKPNCQPY